MNGAFWPANPSILGQLTPSISGHYGLALTSYGIPTGPIASNLLAEALLHKVDEYLLSYGFRFIRFIDDYYFFCSSDNRRP